MRISDWSSDVCSSDLGINPVQFNIIMHLADIWWEKEHRPWPKKQLLAERMDMSERQIQRQIAELESAGLVQLVERTRPGRGKTSNEYDLSGLVKKLKALEPEFTEMKQENQKRRSEEHTSELQSLMRISYAVFCLKKKKKNNEQN